MSTESQAKNPPSIQPSPEASSQLITLTREELDSLCQRAMKLHRLVSGFYKTLMGVKSRMKRINSAKRRALKRSNRSKKISLKASPLPILSKQS